MNKRSGSKIRKLMTSATRHHEDIAYYPVENSLSDGMPDAYAFIYGWPVWIEHKSAKEKLRPAQKIWHERYAKRGGLVVILREVQRGIFQLEDHTGNIYGGVKSMDMVGILEWLKNYATGITK